MSDDATPLILSFLDTYNRLLDFLMMCLQCTDLVKSLVIFTPSKSNDDTISTTCVAPMTIGSRTLVLYWRKSIIISLHSLGFNSVLFTSANDCILATIWLITEDEFLGTISKAVRSSTNLVRRIYVDKSSFTIEHMVQMFVQNWIWSTI